MNPRNQLKLRIKCENTHFSKFQFHLEKSKEYFYFRTKTSQQESLKLIKKEPLHQISKTSEFLGG